MAKPNNISMAQYLILVGHGYDGDTVRKWTRHRARREIEHCDLAGTALEQLGSSACSRRGRLTASKPLTRPASVSASDAKAAGLAPEAATILAQASKTYGEGRLVARLASKVERDQIRTICLQVLTVVGLGSVDTYVLNHFIREVLRVMLKANTAAASRPMSERLCRIFAAHDFDRKAKKAMHSYIKEVQSGPKRSVQHASLRAAMTESWIVDGGWRAYWFALDVLRHIYPRFRSDESGADSLDNGLAAALRFIASK